MKLQTQVREALRWWQYLSGHDSDDLNKVRSVNTGAIAELRRVRTPVDALLNTQAIDLVKQLQEEHPTQQVRVASLAAVLAHIKTDDPSHYMATRLGGPNEDERLMKTIRFRRLMQSEFGEERITAFRRSIQMLKGVANVSDVANAWLSWDHDVWGEKTRIAWMFRYVGANGKELGQKEPAVDSPHDDHSTLPEDTSA